ncbi:MAG TPA: aldo/keto reductase [Opitutaceae bacterium]|nr:aldo/keto reductase [Opitutaceae bacterium]
MNRRRFLQQATTGAASVALIGLTLNSRAAAEEKSRPAGKIITRTLGRTGIQVPIVSMGVMNADNPELLKESYKRGVRHFDTAWYYQRGNNERMVGQALREAGGKREDYTVATKIFLGDGPGRSAKGAAAKALFLKRAAESLSRLQMEYVDILYYHSLDTREQVLDPGIIEALTELKAEKKVRFTGLSMHCHWPGLLTLAADQGFYDVALLSYNYSMQGNPAFLDAMQHACAKGMGLVAMKTQCQQEWYREGLPADLQKFYEGQIMHTALLKWVLRHEQFATAIPGYTTFQQMEEDFPVARSLDYTPDEKKFLEDRHVQLALLGACQICGGCTGSCPKGVDLPNLMRTHMYARSYGNAIQAGETFRAIAPGRSLAACADCSPCTARCVRRVDIAGRLAELKMIYA